MPTYQYACTACDHAFEQVQSFSEDSLTVCPECQGRLRKVFNAVGVVFKGSGFYRTDSRSENGSTSESAPKVSEKKSDTGSGSEKKTADSPSKSTDSSSGTKSDPGSTSKSTSAA